MLRTTVDSIENVGRRTLDTIDELGSFALFTLATVGWTFRGVHGFSRTRLLLPQLFEIGTKSIPVVLIVGGFVGAVLGLEMFDQFAAIGQEARIGGGIDLSVVKQIGPVLAAVMIAGRVGGAVTAELGTMRVTEQLDALRVMGTDPIAHLVVPRVLACLLMVPMLTIFSNVIGIAGGYLVVVCGFGVNAADYNSFASQFVGSYDVITGLVKAVVFGVTIGMIACHKGFNCKPGAEGVGRAATDSFVTSFIAIIVINFFLAKFLKDLYHVLYGYGGMSVF